MFSGYPQYNSPSYFPGSQTSVFPAPIEGIQVVQQGALPHACSCFPPCHPQWCPQHRGSYYAPAYPMHQGVGGEEEMDGYEGEGSERSEGSEVSEDSEVSEGLDGSGEEEGEGGEEEGETGGDGEGGEEGPEQEMWMETFRSELEDLEWAQKPGKLRNLEELRGSFKSELADPSAWTLQRITELGRGNTLSTAKVVVALWKSTVAEHTKTPQGKPLNLPHTRRPEGLPFHKVVTWKEADGLRGEARQVCFGRGAKEEFKQEATVTILFLFPEAKTKGLSENEKERIFTVASKVWLIHQSRAEGLLWVLDNEFPHTREDTEPVREWTNDMSEDFMTYTALYPPPIFASRY